MNHYYNMNKYCPICGSLMRNKMGKYGKFRGCINYPECNWTESYNKYGKIEDNFEEIEHLL